MQFLFDNSYARLPEIFYARCKPAPVSAPRLIAFNRPLAEQLGLDAGNTDPALLATLFSGNQLAEGAEPLAMAYAGHQFGNFVPQLGDGRAILLGELIDRDGHRFDIQLKGAGRTPFSRGGDGRSPLGPVLREYLISEAMHALGVPTTRALAAVLSGDTVHREERQPGAILTRVAASHVRIGTFEFFAARRDTEHLQALADYVIGRHYPEAADSQNPALTLLDRVIQRQAELVAHWMSIGFIHGVMNTDNMTISGETIDYGPCAFMDSYHPETVFSSIDHAGRYAYRMQPAVAQWNLARLAESLVPLIDADQSRAIELAKASIAEFNSRFQNSWLGHMRAKLGLQSQQPDDPQLINSLLDAMANNQVDFTLLFRRLSEVSDGGENQQPIRELFSRATDWDNWYPQWAQRLQLEGSEERQRVTAMRACNPAIIPRNHRIEEAIDKARQENDLSGFERLREMLARPFADDPESATWLSPPAPGAGVFQTFCGT